MHNVHLEIDGQSAQSKPKERVNENVLKNIKTAQEIWKYPKVGEGSLTGTIPAVGQ